MVTKKEIRDIKEMIKNGSEEDLNFILQIIKSRRDLGPAKKELIQNAELGLYWFSLTEYEKDIDDLDDSW